MSELSESESQEQQIAPEIPRGNWQTLLFIQRHSMYDNRTPPANPTPEEQVTLGHLTIEGKMAAAEVDDKRIEAILGQGDPSKIDFIILNSPTFWFDDTRLGQRARETAEILADRTIDGLQKRGLPQSQLLNTTERFKGDGKTRPEQRIQEGKMFQFSKYVTHMREKYGGQGPNFWAARNLDSDPEDVVVRERVGAPSAMGDAKEISDTMVMAARYARAYHDEKLHPENKDRRLVIWMVSHGDGTQPYVQRVVGAPPEDFKAGYNEGFGITIDDKGEAKALVKGKEYPMEFPKSGRNVKIRSNEEMSA